MPSIEVGVRSVWLAKERARLIGGWRRRVTMGIQSFIWTMPAVLPGTSETSQKVQPLPSFRIRTTPFPHDQPNRSLRIKTPTPVILLVRSTLTYRSSRLPFTRWTTEPAG